MNRLPLENIRGDSENDSLEIKKSLYDLFSDYDKSNEDNYINKYKWNKYAMKQFYQAKKFWKYFPKMTFWSLNYVNELKQFYKDNEYVLEMIEKYSFPYLDPAFRRPLYKANVELYSDIAKEKINQAILQGKTAIISERPIISIKLHDNLVIPFYISTWKWGKLWVEKDKFYPFFWISDDWYFNKWLQSDINNYYWIPLLKAIAIELNDRYKNKKINPHSRPELKKCELDGRKLLYHEDYREFVEYANLWKKPDDHDQHKWIKYNINTTLRKIEWEWVDAANNMMKWLQYFSKLNKIKEWWKYFFDYFFKSIENFKNKWKNNDVISLVNRVFDKLYFDRTAGEFKLWAEKIYGKLVDLGYENIKNWAKKGMISPQVEKAAKIYRSKS